ncbi:MAG: hypothetical protein Q8P22_09600 [Chloroflexota bacterium]|nr:hypothetical protein [Chloroflexota bacterium]
MALQHRRLVRLIQTRTGLRYVVQVPEPQCPIPGWRAYAVLAFGPNGDGDQRLTLYERLEDGPEAPDGQQAA